MASTSWRHRSYEVLPALSVRRHTLRRDFRTITVAWMFGTVWMLTIQGSRMTNFCEMLGFSERDFGLLAALPFVTKFGQLSAAVLMERTGLRKYQFLYCGVLHRGLWLGVAMLPLAFLYIPGLGGLPSRWAVFLMLAVLTISWFSESLAGPAWMMWMGDLIPRRIRGRYFANRSRWSQMLRLPLVFLLAVLADAMTDPQAGMTAAEQPGLLLTLSGIFAFGSVMGMIDILLFGRMRDVIPSVPDRPREPAIDIQLPRVHGGILGRVRSGGSYLRAVGDQILLDALRDRYFMRAVVTCAVIVFSMAVAAPYYFRNMLRYLGLSQLAVDSLFLGLGPVVAILVAKPWGRLVDAWGRRPVMILGMILAVFSVLPHLLAHPSQTGPVWLRDAANALALGVASWFGSTDFLLVPPGAPVGAWLVLATSVTLGSMGWSGVMLAQGNLVLGFADSKGRSKYVAAFTVLVSVGGLLAGFAGGEVAQRLEQWGLSHSASPLVIGSWAFNNWHATFVLSWLARIAGLVLLIFFMKDPGSRRFRDMIRNLPQSLREPPRKRRRR
jgi:MFS family permease